jgi:hypothetical protein
MTRKRRLWNIHAVTKKRDDLKVAIKKAHKTAYEKAVRFNSELTLESFENLPEGRES